MRRPKRHLRQPSSPAKHCVSSGCSRSVSKQPYIKLVARAGLQANNDCDHLLCMPCFATAVANKGSDRLVSCSGCNIKSDTWDLYPFAVSKHKDPVRQSVAQPDPNTHPIEYYASQTNLYRKNTAVITLSLPSPDDSSKTRTFVSTLREDGDNSPQNCDRFAAIGTSLHSFMLPMFNFKNREVHSSYTDESTIVQLE